MSLPRKKLSNVFTLLFALNSHGIVKREDISWIRVELSIWSDAILKKVGL